MKTLWTLSTGLALITASAAFWAAGAPARASFGVAVPAPAVEDMEHLLAVGARTDHGTDVVRMYKAPSCVCCEAWADHLRSHGFTIRVEEVANIMAVKEALGVPAAAYSCHTAVVGGRVVTEGHVPADALRRFLDDGEPGMMGLAVPGMPVGSPGMEVEGRAPDPYEVLAFDDAGRTRVFQRR